MWSRVTLVNAAAATRTPSSRYCASPWLDASSARWSMPSSESAASTRCSAMGSGVVSCSGRHSPSTQVPRVPSDAALRPQVRQIWRVKSATEVLPLVPVTQTTTAGCAP